ncbi:MAG TPA: SDR family NAD(P)-dependent oxidoreductase [Polyangiaceae bacterium]
MAKEAWIVTGAGGALGSAMVARLAREGLVIAAGRGVRQEQLDAEYGAGRARAAALDVGSRSEWANVLEGLESQGITAAGAVLTAGTWRGGQRLHEQADDADWGALLDANLETARASLQALLPGMVARRKGSVVLVGSTAAVRPWEQAGAAAYAASKAALLALSQAVAAEVLADGVRVNVILPSTIDTPANRAAMPKADASRWVAPASLAEVAAFLLSDAGRDISGAALPVYGRTGV